MAAKRKTINKKATSASAKIATRPNRNRVAAVTAKSSPKPVVKSMTKVISKSLPAVNNKIGSSMHTTSSTPGYENRGGTMLRITVFGETAKTRLDR